MAKQLKWYDKVFERLGYRKQGISVSTVGEYSLLAPPLQNASERINAMRGWVFACAKARANDVAQIELRLFKSKNDDVEEIFEHEVLSLLRSVNPWMTFEDLLIGTQVYKDLVGEAFWYLARNNNSANGEILQIWLLRPDWMEIKTDKLKFITGYEYQVPGGEKMPLLPHQVLHFKEFNPTDPYRGLSIVGAAALTIETEHEAEKYNRQFFKNQALPAAVLSTERSLDEDIKKRARAEWQNTYGGTDRSHRVAILEGGLEIKPFSMSQRDMEFLAGMGYNRDKILALFQVPKTVLGMTENVTVSNAEATDLIFAKRTIKPLMRRIVATLNEFLLPYYNDDSLFFDFNDPTPENTEAKLKKYDTMFRLGAMTPNEIRDAEGYDNEEGLDNFYIQTTMTPIMGEPDEEEQEPIPGQEADEEQEPVKAIRKKKLKFRAPPKRLKTMLADKVAADVRAKLMPMFEKFMKSTPKKKEWQIVPQEAQEKRWQEFVVKGENFEGRFKKLLIDNFERQENETITRLHKAEKVFDQSKINDVLMDLPEENKTAIKITLPMLKDALEDAGIDTMAFVGASMPFSMSDELVRQFFSTRALRGIKVMNKFTKKKLRQLLADSVKEGDSIAVIARKIRDLFGEAKTTRATRIARTEVARASNEGTLAAYRQSGVVVGKQWFTALDERVCAFCAPMHGVIIPLKDSFFDKGATWVGSNGKELKLNFEEVNTAHMHVNCRCTLMPVTMSQIQSRSINKQQHIDIEAIKNAIKEELKDEVVNEVNKEIDKLVETI